MPRRKKRQKKRKQAYSSGNQLSTRNGSYRRYKNISFGFADSQVMKHRYVQVISLDTDGLSPAVHHFRCNSPYDPDYTGTGNQPMNRDLMAGLYNHYTVLGSKITAQFHPHTDQNSVSPVVCYVELLDDVTTVSTSYIQAMERKRNKNVIIPHRNNYASPAVTNYYSAKKFFGVKDVIDNLTRIGGSGNTNPSDDAIFTCGVMALDGSTNLSAISVAVTIDYTILWTEPIPQARS